MINKLTIILILGVFLSSCSNQRFGYLAKVKNNNRHQSVVKDKKEVKKDVENSEAYAAQVQSAAELTMAEVLPEVLVENQALPEVKKTSFSQKIKTTRALIKTLKEIKNTETPSTQANVNSAVFSKEKKEKVSSLMNTVERGGWLWWILVGVLLVFIGAILPVPVLNAVIWVIGVVLICYGILVLLLG